MKVESIGTAIHNARALLTSGDATVQAIGAAIGALAAAGALVKPEGIRILGELQTKLSSIGRTNSIRRWKDEADQMTARHAAERAQLIARAQAEIPDTGDAELFPRARKAAESTESGSVAGLPYGLYRHADGREYLNEPKAGRRPSWLSREWLVRAAPSVPIVSADGSGIGGDSAEAAA